MAADLPALPIVPGYAYALRLKVTGDTPVFPVGCQLRAAVRHYVGASAELAILTTENGGLTRVDDDTIDVRLSATQTEAIKHTSVVIDFARMDPEPDVFLYVLLSIPVLKPVTQRAA